jgi:hypothetical protein
VPCYRCGTRQVDPEAGKSSPWRRGVVREHQVLICPACQPSAVADLTRCTRCESAHLIRRLDQVECLDCRLTRDAEPEPPDLDPPAPGPGSAASRPGPAVPERAPAPPGSGSDLAAEVARALERLRSDR